jgi:hypothetical protein
MRNYNHFDLKDKKSFYTKKYLFEKNYPKDEFHHFNLFKIASAIPMEMAEFYLEDNSLSIEHFTNSSSLFKLSDKVIKKYIYSILDVIDINLIKQIDIYLKNDTILLDYFCEKRNKDLSDFFIHGFDNSMFYITLTLLNKKIKPVSEIFSIIYLKPTILFNEKYGLHDDIKYELKDYFIDFFYLNKNVNFEKLHFTDRNNIVEHLSFILEWTKLNNLSDTDRDILSQMFKFFHTEHSSSSIIDIIKFGFSTSRLSTSVQANDFSCFISNEKFNTFFKKNIFKSILFLSPLNPFDLIHLKVSRNRLLEKIKLKKIFPSQYTKHNLGSFPKSLQEKSKDETNKQIIDDKISETFNNLLNENGWGEKNLNEDMLKYRQRIFDMYIKETDFLLSVTGTYSYSSFFSDTNSFNQTKYDEFINEIVFKIKNIFDSIFSSN